MFEYFFICRGISHRLSSAYHPQSNGRAEVAVKSAKRLLRSNTGSSGTLDTDRFLRAMMQLRNTPDPDCNLSPAAIVFGRPIRDAFAFINRLEKFSNKNIRPIWREAWQRKEEALRERFHRTAEKLNEHSRRLVDLNVGDRCYVQNQTGNFPKRWDRSGTVVEMYDHDSFAVKIDGTGRVTRRNRRFLRKFSPVSPVIQFQQLHTDLTKQTGTYTAYRPMHSSTSCPHRIPLLQSGQRSSSTPDPRFSAESFRDETPMPATTLTDEEIVNKVTDSDVIVPKKHSLISSPSSSSTDLPPLSIPASTQDNRATQDDQTFDNNIDSTRPRRTVRSPLRYEPETGAWI